MTNRLQLVIFIGIGVIALVIALVIFGVGRKDAAPEPVTLEFWGYEDDEEIWQEVITKFQEKNKNFTINYTRFPESTYEEILVNRLAEGRGPDLFLLPNTSAFKHKDKIFALPREFGVSKKDFERAFADIVARDLIGPDGEILGIPLFIDTLALVYNRDILNTAGIAAPPQDWNELADLSARLTKLNPAKDVVRSGAALGTFLNIERAFELISSLMLQEGDQIVERGERGVVLGPGAISALRFYTSFADPNSRRFSWTARLKDSFTARGEGNTALVFANAGDLSLIEAKNPHLSFRVAPLPQPKGSQTAITYGSYFFPTVSKSSANPNAAWQFILGVAYGEEVKTYLELTRRPPARRDLISAGTEIPNLDVYWRQALSARSWFIPDEKRVRNLFRDVIEPVAARTIGAEEAINRLEQQLKLLLP
jgi:multiple sugar transport system substrate-binding protein